MRKRESLLILQSVITTFTQNIQYTFRESLIILLSVSTTFIAVHMQHWPFFLFVIISPLILGNKITSSLW